MITLYFLTQVVWYHKIFTAFYFDYILVCTGLGSSVRCVPNWWSGGRGFVALIRHHSFVEIDYEIFSVVILSLLLIQEEQFVNYRRKKGTEYWLTT